MKKVFYLLLPLLLLSCGNKSNSSTSENEDKEDKSTYYANITIEGYNTGYEHGANDGWNDSYKSSFTLSSKYLFDEEKSNYETGYRKGYSEGYNAGKAAYKEELAKLTKDVRQVFEKYENSNVTVTTSSTPNTNTYTYSSPSTSTETTDFHDWEEDEIRAFYVEIEDCESDEQAEYISNKYYLRDYIKVYDRYFARTSVKNGTYEAELGEKVTSKLYKIRGTDVFMQFMWLPNASKWDEGVLEVWANKGSFYKKPD